MELGIVKLEHLLSNINIFTYQPFPLIGFCGSKYWLETEISNHDLPWQELTHRAIKSWYWIILLTKKGSFLFFSFFFYFNFAMHNDLQCCDETLKAKFMVGVSPCLHKAPWPTHHLQTEINHTRGIPCNENLLFSFRDAFKKQWVFFFVAHFSPLHWKR